MPRGVSAKTQARDEKTGRFVTRAERFPLPLEDIDGWGPKLSIPRRPSRWANFTRLVSHHRMAILGYTLYLMLIAVVSVLGAYYGAKVGLP